MRESSLFSKGNNMQKNLFYSFAVSALLAASASASYDEKDVVTLAAYSSSAVPHRPMPPAMRSALSAEAQAWYERTFTAFCAATEGMPGVEADWKRVTLTTRHALPTVQEFLRRGDLRNSMIHLASSEFTDNDIKAISKILSCAVGICLSDCTQVTDAGLAHLIKDSTDYHPTITTKVSLKNLPLVTSEGFSHLRFFKKVDFIDLPQLKDSDLEHLENARHITISNCHGITNAGLIRLTSLQTLVLTDCPQITTAAKTILRNHYVDVTG